MGRADVGDPAMRLLTIGGVVVRDEEIADGAVLIGRVRFNPEDRPKPFNRPITAGQRQNAAALDVHLDQAKTPVIAVCEQIVQRVRSRDD